MKGQNQGSGACWWVFFPLCIGLGSCAGALLGNVGVGMSIGAAVGTALNLIFYYRLKKEDPE